MEQYEILNFSHNEKMHALELTPWGHDLTTSQLDILANHFRYYSVPANTKIIEEGQDNDFFCVICKGSVDIVKSNFSEEPKHLYTFGPGKTFGEMSFFDGTACSASVVTNDNVNLLSISKKHFQNLCENYPAVALYLTLNMIAVMSHRLRQTTGKLIDHM